MSALVNSAQQVLEHFIIGEEQDIIKEPTESCQIREVLEPNETKMISEPEIPIQDIELDKNRRKSKLAENNGKFQPGNTKEAEEHDKDTLKLGETLQETEECKCCCIVSSKITNKQTVLTTEYESSNDTQHI